MTQICRQIYNKISDATQTVAMPTMPIIMEYKYSFEKLEVWNDARNLVKMIYLHTNNFPERERFGLSSQMQRTVVSIVSNIAEGVSRNSVKEKIRFVELAYGSLMELYCQLYVSVDLDYLTPNTFTLIKVEIAH